MYKIITDSASNLTEDILNKYDIDMLSYKCMIDNEPYMCYEPGRDDTKDGKEFYDKIRHGASIVTSLISPGDIITAFSRYMKQGFDVLFLTISSKLSGTYQSALIAAEEMSEQFPERKCVIIDSLSASLGEGFLAVTASKLRALGHSIYEAAGWILANRLKMCHIFTVDDLKYLKKGGRISSAVSMIGSALNIKPVLAAGREGTIELFRNLRGRKKALDAIVDNYIEFAASPENELVGIAHCDCPEDADYIASRIQKLRPPKELIKCYYDRCTGSHVGPGALCLFFKGYDRSMESIKNIAI